MEYTVVSGYSLPELIAEVNQKLLEGWVPAGGVSAIEVSVRKEAKVGMWTDTTPVKKTMYMQALTLSVT